MSCRLSEQTKATSQDSLALSHADQLSLPLPSSCQLCRSCSLSPSRRFSCSLAKNVVLSRSSIFFSILLDWRSHLAKTLFIFHKYLKYIKSALFIENYLHFMKNCIRPLYEKLKPLKSGFIENSNFENNRDPWCLVDVFWLPCLEKQRHHLNISTHCYHTNRLPSIFTKTITGLPVGKPNFFYFLPS